MIRYDIFLLKILNDRIIFHIIKKNSNFISMSLITYIDIIYTVLHFLQVYMLKNMLKCTQH